MHSFARRLHGSRSAATAGETDATAATNGLVLKMDWRYDLHGWLLDTFSFRGQLRDLRRRTITIAGLRPGEQALDVGCGTGTLALDAQRRVGRAGYVAGVDPGVGQIALARAKAARRQIPAEFQVGVIEQLPFPDQRFDVVFSTLMMHHLPDTLKRQGLAEVARVLKPGGRLVIADFTRKRDRQGQAARFHAGGTDAAKLATLLQDAGFERLSAEELRPRRFSAFPGALVIKAYKRLE